MQCSKCNIEMEKGWSAKARWKKGEPPFWINWYSWLQNSHSLAMSTV